MRPRFKKFQKRIKEILHKPETDILTFLSCIQAFKGCFSEDNKRDSRVISEILDPIEEEANQILGEVRGLISISEREKELKKIKKNLKQKLPDFTKQELMKQYQDTCEIYKSWRKDKIIKSIAKSQLRSKLEKQLSENTKKELMHKYSGHCEIYKSWRKDRLIETIADFLFENLKIEDNI